VSETRTYRELVEAGAPSVDRTARRALHRGRAARCDVCGRIVSWRRRSYGGDREAVLTTHTRRLGTGQTGGQANECPGSGLPVVVTPYVRPMP
jgi:hypothetical protein